MNFFISYRNEDRQLAGRIAQYLHDDHHECFLAHDDLELTPDFEKEIKERINDCTALIAAVTPSFAVAAYPNQEVGCALALDKPIIPMWFPDVNIEELGFIKRVQSIHAKEDNLHQSVLKAVEWAETRLTENFVHPTDGGSVGESN